MFSFFHSFHLSTSYSSFFLCGKGDSLVRCYNSHLNMSEDRIRGRKKGMRGGGGEEWFPWEPVKNLSPLHLLSSPFFLYREVVAKKISFFFSITMSGALNAAAEAGGGREVRAEEAGVSRH